MCEYDLKTLRRFIYIRTPIIFIVQIRGKSGAPRSPLIAGYKSKKPIAGMRWAFWVRRWRLPTFAREIRTIIGVTSFHAPVRDGKGWGQGTMAASNSVASCLWATCGMVEEVKVDQIVGADLSFALQGYCTVAQSYRVKPHGQLVSVSLTHYCASTPDLSTSWSRTTL